MLQLVFFDVEFVRLEFGVVAKPAPRQWKQIGSHAEKSAEAQHGVRYLARDLVDHQPFDVADHVAVRPPHRGAFDTIAGDQLMRPAHDVECHWPLHTSDEVAQRSAYMPVPASQFSSNRFFFARKRCGKNRTTTLPFRKG